MKKPKALKKEPKQARSQELVDSILESTTRVLEEGSLEETTTNKIAERAGVGIGSLYEYFTSKESIVTKLIDNRTDKVTSEIKKIVERNDDTTLECRSQEIVDYFAANFFVRKKLLREIFLLAPETGRMEALYLGRIEVIEVLTKYLHRKKPELGEALAHEVSFTVVNGVMGMVETYVMYDGVPMKTERMALRLKETMDFMLREYR